MTVETCFSKFNWLSISIPKGVTESTDEINLMTFKGIKSKPVSFLGFLSFPLYLTIETTQQKKKKKARKMLIGESKDMQARKARRCACAY